MDVHYVSARERFDSPDSMSSRALKRKHYNTQSVLE